MDNLVKGQLETVYKVAVASNDGIVINQHFGRANIFYIYEITETGKHRLLETRTVTPICNGGNHSDKELRENISLQSMERVVLENQLRHRT